MIYRDDDISQYTDLETIMAIQDVFDHHGKIHTVTIIMERLWESRGVWEWLMTTENIDVAFHGWIHCDYAGVSYEGTLRMFRQSLTEWKKHTERMGYTKQLKVFYPPWNSWNANTARACEEVGLELNASIDTSEVYNFHWYEFVKQNRQARIAKFRELGEVLKRDHPGA